MSALQPPPASILAAALKVAQWAESQCAIPGSAWAVGPVASRKAHDAQSAELYEAKAWLRNAERILEGQGYRRCDIPACNCSSYHHHGPIA